MKAFVELALTVLYQFSCSIDILNDEPRHVTCTIDMN